MAGYPPLGLTPWYTALREYIETLPDEAGPFRDSLVALIESMGDEIVDEGITDLTVGRDVILLAGQSNMVGLGTPLDSTYLDGPDARIKQLAGSGTYLGTMVAGIDPLLHHGAYPNAIGPGMTFAKWWADNTSRKVLLVPCAHGGTGFTTTSVTPAPAGYHFTSTDGGSWDPNATDGGTNLFDFAVSQTNKAIIAEPGNRIVAILWQQGAADGTAAGAAILTEAEYADKMDALIEGFRTEIIGAADVPVLVGRENLDWYAPRPSDLFLDKVHLDTPVRQQLSAWAAPGALGTTIDGAHLNAPAQRLAGGTYYPEAYRLAVANLLSSAPIAPVNVRATQSGTTLTVTWDRPLCRANNYRVQYDAGSGWVTASRTASTENVQVLTGLTLGTTVSVRVATINENGTSANSEISLFPVRNIPAAPTGLAVTPTAWSAAGQWDDTADATSYSFEYKKNVDATWIPLTSTVSEKVAAGLASSTLYNFRVKAVNEAGSSAYSTTVNATTGAPTILADDVGVTPLWAWSLRKVVSGYAGSAIKVRRSSDNVEADIGFTAGGDLNTTALLAHVGAGSGFISRWYNQGTAGAAADFIQATTTLQPRIALTGVVDVKNTKPAAKWDTSFTQYMQAATNGVLAAPQGVTFLSVASTRASLKALFSEMAVTGTASSWVPLYAASTFQSWWTIKNSANTNVLSLLTAEQITDDDTLNQETVVDTTTAATVRRNSVATSVNASPYTRTGTFAPAIIRLGAFTAGTGHDGYISEVVVWNTTPLGYGPGESNQRGYYGTP